MLQANYKILLNLNQFLNFFDKVMSFNNFLTSIYFYYNRDQELKINLERFIFFQN